MIMVKNQRCCQEQGAAKRRGSAVKSISILDFGLLVNCLWGLQSFHFIRGAAQRVFEKVSPVMLSTQRSPLAPLKKGGNHLKVPLFKGDLGGSCTLCYKQ
jgi:hypothetical protein